MFNVYPRAVANQVFLPGRFAGALKGTGVGVLKLGKLAMAVAFTGAAAPGLIGAIKAGKGQGSAPEAHDGRGAPLACGR